MVFISQDEQSVTTDTNALPALEQSHINKIRFEQSKSNVLNPDATTELPNWITDKTESNIKFTPEQESIFQAYLKYYGLNNSNALRSYYSESKPFKEGESPTVGFTEKDHEVLLQFAQAKFEKEYGSLDKEKQKGAYLEVIKKNPDELTFYDIQLRRTFEADAKNVAYSYNTSSNTYLPNWFTTKTIVTKPEVYDESTFKTKENFDIYLSFIKKYTLSDTEERRTRVLNLLENNPTVKTLEELESKFDEPEKKFLKLVFENGPTAVTVLRDETPVVSEIQAEKNTDKVQKGNNQNSKKEEYQPGTTVSVGPLSLSGNEDVNRLIYVTAVKKLLSIDDAQASFLAEAQLKIKGNYVFKVGTDIVSDYNQVENRERISSESISYTFNKGEEEYFNKLLSENEEVIQKYRDQILYEVISNSVLGDLTSNDVESLKKLGITEEQILAAQKGEGKFSEAVTEREEKRNTYVKLVNNYYNFGDSENLASFRALNNLGLVSDEKFNEVLTEENRVIRERAVRELTDEYYQQKQLSANPLKSESVYPSLGEKRYFPSEEDIQRKFSEYKGDQKLFSYSELVEIRKEGNATLQSGFFSQVLSGAIDTGGGKVSLSYAGLLRPFSGIPGISTAYNELRRAGQSGLLIGEISTGGTFIGKTANFIGSLPVDLARLYVLSRIPGLNNPIAFFAVDSALTSSGSGNNPRQVINDAIKGGAFGAVFSGASLLGKNIAPKIFEKVLPQSTIEEIRQFYPAFVAAKNAGLNPVIDPAIRNAFVLAKFGGKATEVATIFTGTITVEKFSGATNEEAFNSGAANAIFSLAGTAGKPTKEALMSLSGRVIRYWENGKSAYYSVEPKSVNGEVVFGIKKYERLPNEPAYRAEVTIVNDSNNPIYKRSELAKQINPIQENRSLVTQNTPQPVYTSRENPNSTKLVKNSEIQQPITVNRDSNNSLTVKIGGNNALTVRPIMNVGNIGSTGFIQASKYQVNATNNFEIYYRRNNLNSWTRVPNGGYVPASTSAQNTQLGFKDPVTKKIIPLNLELPYANNYTPNQNPEKLLNDYVLSGNVRLGGANKNIAYVSEVKTVNNNGVAENAFNNLYKVYTQNNSNNNAASVNAFIDTKTGKIFLRGDLQEQRNLSTEDRMKFVSAIVEELSHRKGNGELAAWREKINFLAERGYQLDFLQTGTVAVRDVGIGNVEKLSDIELSAKLKNIGYTDNELSQSPTGIVTSRENAAQLARVNLNPNVLYEPTIGLVMKVNPNGSITTYYGSSTNTAINSKLSVKGNTTIPIGAMGKTISFDDEKGLLYNGTYYKMHVGQILTIGRDAQILTGSEDTSISRVHYTIMKTTNGWEIYNGTNPQLAENQIVAFYNGKVMPFVSGNTYPSGTSFIPKLSTGQTDFFGITNQTNAIGMQKVSGKSLTDLQKESINLQKEGKTFLFNAGNTSTIAINGVFNEQLDQTNRAIIAGIIYNNPDLISSITFVDSIGTEAFENGQIGKKINAAYDFAGNVYIDNDLLQNPEKFNQILLQVANRRDLSRRVLMSSSDKNGFVGYTEVFKIRSEEGTNQIRLLGDPTSPYGTQVSINSVGGINKVTFRPVITGGYNSTDSAPIKDGLIPSLYDGSTRPNYVVNGNAIEVRSKQFLSSVQERLRKQDGLLNKVFQFKPDLSIEQLLTDANNYTRNNFFDPKNLPKSISYDRDNIPDMFAMRNAPKGSIPSTTRVSFNELYDSQGIYSGNGQTSKDKFLGVCKHQSIFLKYVLDDLVLNGILPQDTKVFVVSNQTTGAGHAFVRVELNDGRVWILDPRNNVSSDLRNLVDDKSWKYTSTEDDLGNGVRK